MLKLDQKFKIYDSTPRKAVKSLIQAGFISTETLEPILGKLYLSKIIKNHNGTQTAMDWDTIIDKVFETGLLKYHVVTLHTAPVYYEGFPRPTMGGFPAAGFPTTEGFPCVYTATRKLDNTIYYDVDGVDYPMTLDGIYNKFNQFRDTFVAVCHKGADKKLKLTGFVYKANTGLS